MGGCGLFRAPAVHQKLARPALRGAAPPREWGSDEDTALLLGVHAHGYAAYEAVLADASLPALHGLCLHKEEKPAAAAAAAAAATAATAAAAAPAAAFAAATVSFAAAASAVVDMDDSPPSSPAGEAPPAAVEP